MLRKIRLRQKNGFLIKRRIFHILRFNEQLQKRISKEFNL